MKKKHVLMCNRGLLFVFPIVLASGILLESLHGEPFCKIDNAVWTGFHIGVSSLMLACVVWHIQLNWRSVGEWYGRYRTHCSKGFKCMAQFFLLTTITGLLTLPVWWIHGHTGMGGVHGKIGFVSALFMLLHIKKHWKWY